VNKRGALFTGTFDPFHEGHVFQLVRAHAAQPFEKVTIAVIQHNTKKPQAAHGKHRVQMARIALEAHELPFECEVKPIDNINPETVRMFTAQQLSSSSKPIRIIGSDSFAEFLDDERLRPSLKDFHYVITLRPESDQAEIEQAFMRTLANMGDKFSGRLVPIPEQDKAIPDISARDLRDDIGAHSGTLLVPEAVTYMMTNRLYSFAEGKER
jgi:cytidyltransferase-like protein